MKVPSEAASEQIIIFGRPFCIKNPVYYIHIVDFSHLFELVEFLVLCPLRAEESLFRTLTMCICVNLRYTGSLVTSVKHGEWEKAGFFRQGHL